MNWKESTWSSLRQVSHSRHVIIFIWLNVTLWKNYHFSMSQNQKSDLANCHHWDSRYYRIQIIVRMITLLGPDHRAVGRTLSYACNLSVLGLILQHWNWHFHFKLSVSVSQLQFLQLFLLLPDFWIGFNKRWYPECFQSLVYL